MNNQKHERLSWDKYFALQSVLIASRGSCPRLKVGAIITKDKKIISSGYNGAVSGMKNCSEVGCLMEDSHCIRAVHAEQNALMQAASNNNSVKGAEIYVTDFPCQVCAKLLIQAGIKKIYYIRDYRKHEYVEEIINKLNIQVEKMDIDENDLNVDFFKEYFTK